MNKKIFLIVVLLVVGLIGVFKQFTATGVTIEDIEAIIENGTETEVTETPATKEEEREEIIVEESSEEEVSYTYDARYTALPDVDNPTTGELIGSELYIHVYFSEESTPLLEGRIPEGSEQMLLTELQLYLNTTEYRDAEELAYYGDGPEEGWLYFTITEYPEALLEVHWDGSVFQGSILKRDQP